MTTEAREQQIKLLEVEAMEQMERGNSVIKGFLKAMIEDDDYFQLVAKLYKKQYDTLIEEGFTDKQALQIVAMLELRVTP